MKDVEVRDTRNFALIGHSADGKTSVGEALLFRAGATRTLGKVNDGSAALMTLPEEKERQASITPSVYAFDGLGKHCTLVDTPGDPNFQAGSMFVLQALDGAVLVVSAVDGVKVGTERMWRAARSSKTPLLAFVNGMDRERADFTTAVESLRKMEANPVVLALPVGASADLRGVIDLLGMRMHTASGEEEVPTEAQEEASAARQRLIESIAECDDALLEKYLEEGELSEEEVKQGLVEGARRGEILPTLAGAATSLVGIDLLLGAAAELLPSPADREPRTAKQLPDETEREVTADVDAPFSAQVFKTVIDRYAGTLSVFRVVSGRLTADATILDATTGSKERLGKLFTVRGNEHDEIPEAGPGDVVAVAKLKDVHTGDVLTSEKGGLRLAEIPIPQGVLSYAIRAKSKGDEDKVFTSLGRLVEEDPTLRLERDAQTGEFLLTGMGELHIRTTVERLGHLFGLEVDLQRPKVPYRETLTRKVENVEGKLKKQTGGRGMFGVCYLTVEPLPRGAGLEFADEIVGGSIPRNLIPAVEKGVIEACQRGPLAGCPVVDIRIRCIDGKYHSVDSNEMSFKLAGSMGLRAAVEKAHPTLLEPIMNMEVVAPDQFMGDIIGESRRRCPWPKCWITRAGSPA
jgi:elongation factor G